MFVEIFVSVLVACLGVACVQIVVVSEGTCALLERFGHFVRILEPGVNFLFRPTDALRRIHRHESDGVLLLDKGGTNNAYSDAATMITKGASSSSSSSSKTTKRAVSATSPRDYFLPTLAQYYTTPEWLMRTADNRTVAVCTALFFRITNVHAAVYEVDDYLSAYLFTVRANVRRLLGKMSFAAAQEYIGVDLITAAIVDDDCQWVMHGVSTTVVHFESVRCLPESADGAATKNRDDVELRLKCTADDIACLKAYADAKVNLVDVATLRALPPHCTPRAH